MRNLQQKYVISAVVVAFFVLFVLSGVASNPSASNNLIKRTVSCGAVNLNFTASGPSNVSAAVGSNTFVVFYMTNDGNVTSSFSLRTTAISSGAPTIVDAGPAALAPGVKGYTQLKISDPQVPGSYTVNSTISSSYLKCVNSKSFVYKIYVNGTNSTNSTV